MGMRNEELDMSGEESGTWKELGSERADVLSRNTSECAQEEPTQSSVCVEA